LLREGFLFVLLDLTKGRLVDVFVLPVVVSVDEDPEVVEGEFAEVSEVRLDLVDEDDLKLFGGDGQSLSLLVIDCEVAR
jgi:hypothetical protein